MKFQRSVSVQWVADFIGAEVLGNRESLVKGINEIHKVEAGDITFVDNEKYYRKALDSAADFIIIDKQADVPDGKTLFVVENPFEAYNSLVKNFRVFTPAIGMISEDLKVGEGTVIQPGVFIGKNCQVGKNCILHANAVLYDHCVLGDNVIIHSGAIIGAEAFYYKGNKKNDLWYEKMQSCGRVIIEDNVEIGAGTTIDKGVSGDTIIGAGTKIDNQVHIGHGTEVGRNCLIAAQVGIGGKAKIEDGVVLWGQVGVSKDLTIGREAVVLAQSGVPSSIAGGKVYFGSPAGEARTMMKQLGWIRRIPELWDAIKAQKRV